MDKTADTCPYGSPDNGCRKTQAFVTRKEKQSGQCISNALSGLLEQKAYHDITISQIAQKAYIGRRTFYRYFQTKDEVMRYTISLLMDDFADTLRKNHAEDLKGISQSYFAFWENHIDMLLLLQKQHLLYFIEDDMPALIRDVAVKINHIPPETEWNPPPAEMEKYLYMFHFRLAGFWKLTLIWCAEVPRKTPEQMSALLEEIL